MQCYINDRTLVDPFRVFHGNSGKYNCKRLRPLQKGRLDFHLITGDLEPFLKNCDIDLNC